MPLHNATDVFKEAKKLRDRDGNRKPWKVYVKQAWAIYYRQHPKKKSVSKKSSKKKTAKRVGFASKVVTGSGNKVVGRKTNAVYNIPTHTMADTMGSLSSHLAASRRILEAEIGTLTGKIMRATTASDRKKLIKKKSEKMAQLRRLQ